MEFKLFIAGIIVLLIAQIMHYYKKKRQELSSSKSFRAVLEWADTIWSAVIFASIIMYFIVQAFKIPSGSMHNTLFEGDHLFVNKFIYGVHIPLTDGKTILPLRKVHRGDIIIFKAPDAALSDEDKAHGITKDFVKRAIGLPGDIVEIKDKDVYVNGQLQAEPYKIYQDKDNTEKGYIKSKIELSRMGLGILSKADYQKLWEEGSFAKFDVVRDNFGPVKVPEGCFFAMGDNRDNSYDSRYWGPIKKKFLKGQALIIYWPLARIRIIK
ncbi:MAG: signal peptidase I [Elusimicrobia bacterium]|nr:signal peptidase I [Elusimicrobiota bacterium]